MQRQQKVRIMTEGSVDLMLGKGRPLTSAGRRAYLGEATPSVTTLHSNPDGSLTNTKAASSSTSMNKEKRVKCISP